MEMHNLDLRGSLTCPDPNTFCAIKLKTCSKACAGTGTCTDGACSCPSGRIGPDCFRFTTVPLNDHFLDFHPVTFC